MAATPEHHHGAEGTAIAKGPMLRVLARPALDESAIQDFLHQEEAEWRRSSVSTDPEDLVEFAGRVCYLSFGERQSQKDNAQYIAHLVAQQHESVLEHATWSFILTGVSRGLSHQLVRHRVGFAFSQLSQQYHDESAASMAIPESISRIPGAAEKWREAVERSHEAYREVLALLDEADVELAPRERLRLIRTAARSVLPAATETKVVFTANARALRHFLSVRGTVEGDEEMRLVSALVLLAMQQEAPSLFADFRLEELADGLPVVRHPR